MTNMKGIKVKLTSTLNIYYVEKTKKKTELTRKVDVGQWMQFSFDFFFNLVSPETFILKSVMTYILDKELFF